ncbi:MAG: GTPase ObgE [Chloroherpetonaceae bacterium]|nr:GTPase ObgE [Chthonomonadaceae bacterium]MDW8209326.1 GTPase ObgE [Chloroherpetonaceae bacterium]
MFVDEVEIEVQAGDGGNGAATFRREKYVPRGGPDGGDGGQGGHIVLQVDTNLTTLLDFRYQRRYRAERGGDGGAKGMFGKNGKDLVLKVPQGTVVTDLETGQQIADLSLAEARAIVARGGVGGRGNAHFVNSVHQAPKFAEKGEPGERKRLRLELKLLADVGLIGYPNVGKSTLIAAVSAARPKIANYPFTTLVPNLGVVYVETGRSFVMADIPGLIEGASQGAGLGHRFLRHVERTRLLIHILDVSGMTGREPLRDFEVLNRELALYSAALAQLPQFVALNKLDVATDPAAVDALEAELCARGYPVYRLSAATGQGVRALVYAAMEAIERSRKEGGELSTPAAEHVRIAAVPQEDVRQWDVTRVDAHTFVVTGRHVERMVAMTDFNNEYAVRRLQRILEKMGVNRKLKEMGARDGDTVRIRDVEFDYEDEDRWDEEADAEAVSARPRRRR